MFIIIDNKIHVANLLIKFTVKFDINHIKSFIANGLPLLFSE